MRKILMLCAAVMFCLVCQAENFRIIPTPKKVVQGKQLVFTNNSFSIENCIAGFSPEEMIIDHLTENGFIHQKTGKAPLHIRFELEKKGNEPAESFRLKLNKDGVTVKSSTIQGAWRGAGRMLAIICGPDVYNDGKELKIPELDIYDFPDLDTRAMKIELPNNGSDMIFAISKPVIRTLAMFGFNVIFIDFRGNLECKKHPHLAQEPILKQSELAELIRYSRACGLEPLPMTNTIGHIKRAPLIFPLSGNSTSEWVENKKNAYVVMDITHPQFYNVLFDYFNEVFALFGNPRYFMISCDEFHDGTKILLKKTGKRFPVFFSEYINATHNYMKKFNCKPIFAQDMLFPRQVPWYVNGPANGPKDALETLDLISKDTSIVMWKYNYDPEYPHLTTLNNKKFTDVWCAPWFDPAGTAALSKRCYELKMKLFGTSWWYYPQIQGYPTVGEFAWNAANPVVRENSYYDSIMDHYYFTAKRLPEGVKTIPAKIVGGRDIPQDKAEKYRKISPLFAQPKMFDDPALLITEILPPWDFKKLAEEGNLGITFGDSPLLQTRKKYLYNNALRDVNSLVFYDKNFGKSTKSNIYGTEMAVVGNKVAKLSGRAQGMPELEKGNMAIPENGTVFSFHGTLKPVSGRLTRNLLIKEGMTVRLFKLPPADAKKTTAKAIVCRFSGKKPNVRIYVTAMMPFKQRTSLAIYRIDSATRGKHRTFNSNNLLSGGDPGNSLYTYSVVKTNDNSINPVYCIEYRARTQAEYPRHAVFSVTNDGVASGFTVLGAEEF